jgi:DNA primase large subunit
MLMRLALLALLLLGPLSRLAAQETTAPDARRGTNDARPMAVTPERESAVMTFVERNHPALKDLLASLKSSRPKEYEKAIREIYQASERLANLKERDPRWFELELKNWTLRSQIQLLAAQMVMVSSDEKRSQLRKLLNEQLDLRADMLELERERAEERLKRVEGEIAKVQVDRDRHIERQLDLLMKSAQASKGNGKVSGKGSKRPGANKNKSTVNEPAKAKSNASNLP